MRKNKKLKRWLLIILAGLLILLGGLYIQADRVPGDYKPVVDLPQEQKERISKDFVQHVILDFRNQTQRIEPFTWRITQDQMNRYLACADEIAFLRAGKQRGEVDRAMASAGVAAPMIVLTDTGMKMMIQSTRFDKVLTAELLVGLTEDQKLRVEVVATRLGKLSVPKSVFIDQLDQFRQRVSPRGRESSRGMEGVVAILVAAIDNESITPENTWKINGIGVGLDDVEIGSQELVLHVRPVPPTRP